MDPCTRSLTLRAGGTLAVILAVGALAGRYEATHGRYWMTRANGNIHFIHWGLACIGMLVWLLVFSIVTSAWFVRLEWLLPVRGRWARYLADTVLFILGLFIALLLVLMPIA